MTRSQRLVVPRRQRASARRIRLAAVRNARNAPSAKLPAPKVTARTARTKDNVKRTVRSKRTNDLI